MIMRCSSFALEHGDTTVYLIQVTDDVVPRYTLRFVFTMDFLLLVRLCSLFFAKLIFVHYGVDDGGLVFTQETLRRMVLFKIGEEYLRKENNSQCARK